MSYRDITIKIDLKGGCFVDTGDMDEFTTELVKVLTTSANKKIRRHNFCKTSSNKIHLQNLTIKTFPNT